jgi:hypothetical protein
MTPARFPHSDTPGSTLGCQLPRAYRRLLRPSSALDAKASTTCPFQLVTHTTNPTHKPHHRHTGARPTDEASNAHNTPQRTTNACRTINRHTPHNKKTKTNKTDTPTTHRTKPAAAKSALSRCSRPLSRSQTTTPHHPRHPLQGVGMAGSGSRPTTLTAHEVTAHEVTA